MTKKVNPWLEAKIVYRVRVAKDGKCSIVSFPINKKTGGVIFYEIPDVGEVHGEAEKLTEEGAGSTAQEAIDNYMLPFIERAALADARLKSAAKSFHYHDEALNKVRDRIEALQKELGYGELHPGRP